MRAVGYARVSSVAQRDRETIDSQLRVLPEFIARQGWTLVRDIRSYVDDGKTAKAGHLQERTGFAALLRDAKAGVFDVVVVVDVDRLTRSEDLSERGQVLGAFQAAGVKIASASTGQVLDLSTSMGDLYSGLQVFFAAEENRKRRVRTVEGKLTAIGRGRKPAGPTPYGLRYERSTGTWTVDEPRAAILREVFSRVAAGESCVQIADALTARRAPSPSRTPEWSRAAVYRMVRSRHGLGTWVADKGRGLAMQVPRVVDDKLWHEAQAALIEKGRRGLHRAKHVYLLEALATCGECGSPMLIRSACPGRNGKTNPAAYVCRRRKEARRGEGRCRAAIVYTADADARVWAAVSAALVDPAVVADLERRARERSHEGQSWADDLAKYRTELARLTEVEGTLVALFRAGEMDPAVFRDQHPKAVRQRKFIASQIAVAEKAAVAAGRPVAKPTEWIARLRELAAAATPAQRREIIAALFPRGTVTFDGARVKLDTVAVAAFPDDGGAGAIVLQAADGCSTGYQTITLRLTA